MGLGVDEMGSMATGVEQKAEENGQAQGGSTQSSGAEVAPNPAENLNTPLKVVRALVKQVGEQLVKGEVKATLADYMKLLQLEKEMNDEEPRDIKVTWVKNAEEKERFERGED